MPKVLQLLQQRHVEVAQRESAPSNLDPFPDGEWLAFTNPRSRLLSAQRVYINTSATEPYISAKEPYVVPQMASGSYSRTFGDADSVRSGYV